MDDLSDQLKKFNKMLGDIIASGSMDKWLKNVKEADYNIQYKHNCGYDIITAKDIIDKKGNVFNYQIARHLEKIQEHMSMIKYYIAYIDHEYEHLENILQENKDYCSQTSPELLEKYQAIKAVREKSDD